MADLDILIHPEDYESGVAILHGLDYQNIMASQQKGKLNMLNADSEGVVSTEFEHPDNPRPVELHTCWQTILGGPAMDITNLLWQKTVSSSLLSEEALLLRPEALWLHLLVHSNDHYLRGRGRLIQLVDLVYLTPYIENPLEVLQRLDAPFFYISLMLLKKYFPGLLSEKVYTTKQKRVQPSFHTWATSFDLLNTSRLNPHRIRPLSRLLRFHQGQPQEMGQVLRYIFFPHLRDMRLNQNKLKSSSWVWLGYPFHWAKHFINLAFRH